MQFITILLSFIIVWQLELSAQNDSSYYPLQIGNYWEYWGSEYGKLVKSFTVIKGDTLMRNGKRYFILYNNLQSGSSYYKYLVYLRSENNSLIYKYIPDDACSDHEEILYDFSAKDSTYWPMCLGYGGPNEKYYYGIYITYSDYYLNFGNPIETKSFSNVVIKNEYGTEKVIWNPIKGIGIVKIAKGIGEVLSLAELSPLWQLTGAIINGQKYGVITTSIEDDHLKKIPPTDFSISSFPNPFNSSSKISINTPEAGNLSVCIYNILGQYINSIYNGETAKGNYCLEFNGSGLSGGMYIIVARINSKLTSSKILLLK